MVEEKLDGANCAVSFTPDGQLRLQSRGHFLTGGYREKHFNLFKQWGMAQRDCLWEALGPRYIMYGEWLYAKHTIYYDALPHYFMEFDILDRETGRCLDTASRRALTAGLPIWSAPVLYEGSFRRKKDLIGLLGDSACITGGHWEHLRAEAERQGLDTERILRETDSSRLMEGLYIKAEEGGAVTQRLKYVRASFLQTVDTSQTHWLERPIIPNGLTGPVEALFSPASGADA